MAEQGAESANQAPSKPLFFKIHDRLRKNNEKAYEPEILSIGPYHHGKENVKAMKKHKLRYRESLLERSEWTRVQKQVLLQMVEAMKVLEKKARECYDTPSTLENDDDFVEMMLLDGCFIIELFCRHKERTSEDGQDPESGGEHHDPESRDEYDPELGYKYDPPSGEEYDPIFDLVEPRASIRRDLLLYENQLPFFILVRLAELIEPSLSQKQISEQLREMALFYFKEMRPSPQTKTDTVLRPVSESSTIRSARQSPEVLQPLICQSSEVSESSATMAQGTVHDDNETHLLSFIHDSWFPPLSESESPKNHGLEFIKSLIHDCWFPSLCESESPKNHGLEFIKCTTELVETGIKFKQAKKYTSLLDIKFVNGVMKIPPLCIKDTTECLFRNLIANERYRWATHSKCLHQRYPLGTHLKCVSQRSNCVSQPYFRVTDYCIFMNRLINRAEDAQELQHRQIINNWLGDDEVISKNV